MPTVWKPTLSCSAPGMLTRCTIPSSVRNCYALPLKRRRIFPGCASKSLPWVGTSLPSSPTLIREGNSWECLRRDVEEARRGCVHLLEWIHRAEREEPAIAMGLQRIRKDTLRRREELREMFMKSDPYTPAWTGPPHAHEESLKQAWLEQQKNEWLDHEQAAWEVEGKANPLG